MSTELSKISNEEKEDMARIEELRYLFSLMEDDTEENIHQNLRTGLNVLSSIEELANSVTRVMHCITRITLAIAKRKDVKAQFQLISQLINPKKLDEIERTKQISNRLRREATVFQLIKYSNHLVSIFPILQTMNYIEA
ncbi:hypothetical protein ACVBEE_16460 [Acinetobacter sp. ANC 3781]